MIENTFLRFLSRNIDARTFKGAMTQLLWPKIDKNAVSKNHIFSFACYFHYNDGTPIPLHLNESSLSLESPCEKNFQKIFWRSEVRFFENWAYFFSKSIFNHDPIEISQFWPHIQIPWPPKPQYINFQAFRGYARLLFNRI